MKFWKTCLMLGAALAAVPAQGRPPEAPQEASVTLASRSIRLAPAAGESMLSVVFTTAGGRGRFFGNGELRPSATRPGFYEAGYVVQDNSGGTPQRVEAGTLYLGIPAADADGDTVPDMADFEAGVAIVLAGEAVPNAASAATRVTQPNFSLRLARAGGSAVGEFMTDLVPDTDLGGEYQVLHAEGSVTYRRTETGALLNYSLSTALTNASGVARVLDSNTLRTAAFRLRVSPSRRMRLGPSVLARNDYLFLGEVKVSDGLNTTAAPDYRNWVMQIVDRHDSDRDTVPDVTDGLPPYIAAQPTRQIAAPGETVTLSVVVTGAGPFTYEWQQNGHGLSNVAADPAARVLVLPNVTADDKGSYRVRVSNAYGSVVSDSTSVSFR